MLKTHIKSTKIQILFQSIFFLFSLSYISIVLALEQNAGAWFDFSVNDVLSKHNRIEYNLDYQVRFLNHQNYYELNNFQGGLGYRQTDTLSFWMGYEWGSKNVLNDNPRNNHVWEQMIWQVFENKTLTVRTRTRFEQISQMHGHEWENRFREKVTLYFPNKFLSTWTPVIYDEIFVKLNNPSWSSSKTFDQNQLFLGMDIPISKNTFIEIGYLQQALFGHQRTTLNHILYIGFNFNPTFKPVTQYVR